MQTDLNEVARLAALDEFRITEDHADPDLDEVVALAARLFDVPIALVSLIDATKQVFAARVGLDTCSTDRSISFCAHSLQSDDVMVVPDARLDPRFADNPLVTGDPDVRFYAGAPLRAGSGHVLGALCIVDRKPRDGLSQEDRQSLRQLANLALDRLEHWRLRQAGEAGRGRFQNIAATSPDAIVCAGEDGRITFWNGTAERLFGYSADEAVGKTLDIIVPPHLRHGDDGGMARVAAGGTPRLVGRTVDLDAMHKDGRCFPIELSLSMWDEGGSTSFGAIIRDTSQRRLNEERLMHLAYHDALTGLPSRALIQRRIGEAITHGDAAHLLLLDLDGFKGVNDTLGHQAGDRLLRDVAARLQHCVRRGDTVGRLGGDEFAVLMLSGEGRDPCAVADRIVAALSATFHIDGHPVQIGVSIGIASAPAHASDADDLLAAADLALYQAKREGRRCYRVFTDELRREAMARRAFERELRDALDNHQFALFFQPQVSLVDGTLIGAEALVRWHHPERGLLDPCAFLGAVEEAALAAELGEWVIEATCAQAGHWRRRGWRWRVGINLFDVQLADGGLPSRLRALLDQNTLDADGIELELSEAILLRHNAAVRDTLHALRADGIGIACDNFGSGLAALNVLQSYPLTRLKIDQDLVQNAVSDPVRAAIVGAVAGLGSALGIDIIAEGVETAAQRDLVRASGCTSGQGFLFGEPMSADAFERWVEAQTSVDAASALKG